MRALCILLIVLMPSASLGHGGAGDYIAPNPRPFMFGVEQGNYDGTYTHVMEGHNPDVGASEEHIWQEGGLYVWPSAGAQMTVSSTSVNDDVGGSGATSVFIECLDSNYQPVNEIITMDGQTPVLTTSTDIFRINRMTVIAAGSTEHNEGVVYIGTGTVTGGKPANVYNLIPFDGDYGVTFSAIYTVPAGYTAHILQYISGVGSGKFVEVFFDIRNAATGTNITGYSWNMYQNSINFNGDFGIVGEKRDISLRALSSSAGANVKASLKFLLVPIGQ